MGVIKVMKVIKVIRVIQSMERVLILVNERQTESGESVTAELTDNRRELRDPKQGDVGV